MIGAIRIAARVGKSTQSVSLRSKNVINRLTNLNIGMMNTTNILNGSIVSALPVIPIAIQSAATITTITSSLGSKLNGGRTEGLDASELACVDGEDDESVRKLPRRYFSTNNKHTRISSAFLRQEDDEDGT